MICIKRFPQWKYVLFCCGLQTFWNGQYEQQFGQFQVVQFGHHTECCPHMLTQSIVQCGVHKKCSPMWSNLQYTLSNIGIGGHAVAWNKFIVK